jgi:hypothetical protein
MRFANILIGLAVAVSLSAGPVLAQQTEQEIIDAYLKKTQKEHVYKMGWVSVNFGIDRINRHNDYNDFATLESLDLSNGSFDWIEQGYSLGVDFGLLVNKRFAWSLGGEYWLKMGSDLPSNNLYYLQSAGTAISTDPKSEVQLYGATTSLYYYLLNPPVPQQPLSNLSVRVGGTIGYYATTWDLWAEYENLNLSTAAPEGENTTYKGSAPGFSLGMGIDYPLNFFDLAISTDVSYLYLNFTNVSWYNSQDQEIIATVDGTEDGRVDLDFSGVRGKVEIKRYFSW